MEGTLERLCDRAEAAVLSQEAAQLRGDKAALQVSE